MDSPKQVKSQVPEKVTTLFPEIKSIEKIIITNAVPVTALGTSIPKVPSWYLNFFIPCSYRIWPWYNFSHPVTGAPNSKPNGWTTVPSIRLFTKIISPLIIHIIKTQKLNLPDAGYCDRITKAEFYFNFKLSEWILRLSESWWLTFFLSEIFLYVREN